MKNPFALTIFLNALLLCPGYLVASSDTIVEGETSLPLAYDVDVLVAGGSLAGVEAACVASDKGASVLVIESRPYLATTSVPIRNYGSSLGKSHKLT
jgi:hypothetical protein